jgi:hypothetical protein
MLRLLENLAAELERPRELSAQVVNHLTGTYGLDRATIGTFLSKELLQLEDYEIDLALSPLFTPTLQDQAVFAEHLGQESVPVTRWPALIELLVTRPTRAQLVTADGQRLSVPLRDVTIERYVHRLRLEATIPGPLFKLLSELHPPSDRPLLQAVARRAVWENPARREILTRFLASAIGTTANRLNDAVALLKVVESYQPTDPASLLAQIPNWLAGLRQEINDSAGGKPFFNERVEELHGGGRDQRRQDNSRITAKENERAFLERLQQGLAA